MRRLLVCGVLVLGVLCGIGGVGDAPRAVAQEATPDTSAVQLSPLMQEWVDAFNDRDGDAIAGLYADDGTMEDVPTGMSVRGQDAIAASMTEAFNRMVDCRLDITRAHETDEFAVLEYVFSGTDPSMGMPVSIRGTVVVELDGDQIRRSSDYYDSLGILIQLGLIDIEQLMAGMATPVP